MEIAVERPSTSSLEIERVRSLDGALDIKTQHDFLAVEEPLEIRIEYGPKTARTRRSISITMRTPGNDFELAVGFLVTEGILRNNGDLEKVEFCGPSKNVVRVDIKPGIAFDLKKLERHFYTSSSCGVCGKSSIEALRVQSDFNSSQNHLSVSIGLIHQLPKTLREQQGIFDSTGGLHACAVFDTSGNLLVLREDVGRHNALDKLVGHFFMKNELPLHHHLLLVSGRASFELVQKAAMAGIHFFAAVGAPSSLAVELAKESNMTLVGFLRDQRFNIYCGAERIQK